MSVLAFLALASMTTVALWPVFLVGVQLMCPLGAREWEDRYMRFADRRTWGSGCCRIPHGSNVVSNAAFFAAALWHAGHTPWMAMGAGVVGVGSTLFHLDPTHDGLLVDRISMVIGLACVVDPCGILNWFVVTSVGLITLYAWYFHDEVVPYLALQAFTPLLLYWYAPGMTITTLLLYLLAKLAEACDAEVLQFTRKHLRGCMSLSGHALKHVLAAAALVAVQAPDCAL